MRVLLLSSCLFVGGLAQAANDLPGGGIDPQALSRHVRVLASDEFEGRAPASEGEERTVQYLIEQFRSYGLQPGGVDGSWVQPVPLVRAQLEGAATASLALKQGRRALVNGVDVTLQSLQPRARVQIKDAPLVFVGYGIDAPERHWNDYKDIDLHGKIAVMLINDADFEADAPGAFDGKAVTYYGRWTYKFEEAARKGAAAAFIVHDTAGASYGWDVVKNSWAGPQYDLPAKDDPEPRLPAQGWLSADAARQLFADAGLDLDQAYKDANKRGFKPVPLKAKISLDLKSTIAEKKSRNVVGVLPGTKHADEAVLYMAHWDHLGKHEGEQGDNIYNGAIDNATGVAGILEIADAMAHEQPAPERSVVFLAVTLEESGLLGSKYYVNHPTFPLDKIAGVINIDAMSVAGKAKDLTVTGFGSSQLEDILKPLAAEKGRTLHGETSVQSGFYFRSDHFNFAKAGVPALYADGGEDLLDGGVDAGRKAAEAYGRDRYHGPKDEYDASTWKLDGTVEDLELLHGVGKAIAVGGQWPNWYEGNPFKAARDEMMKGKTEAAAPAPAAK